MKQIIQVNLTSLRNPTDWRRSSWLFTSVVYTNLRPERTLTRRLRITPVHHPHRSATLAPCREDFFAKFVVERVLKHLKSLCSGRVNACGITDKECYTALRASGIISDDMWKDMDQVDKLTREELVEDACQTPSLKARRNVVGPTILVSSLRPMQSSRNCAEAFVAACKLLLELSCFPVCVGSASEPGKADTKEGKANKELDMSS